MSAKGLENSFVLNVVFILSSCFVAAAGYLINDYYDQEIDKINKPEKKFPFTSKNTWVIYIVMNIVALTFGFLFFSVAFTLVFILLPIWGLWLYSFILKSVALLGNFTIAMLAVWLPIGVVLLNVPDFYLSQQGYSGATLLQFNQSKSIIFLLASCSFLTTFSREIVKDIQDIKGDKALNSKTFPIVVGKDFAMICAAGLLIISSLIWGNFTFKNIEVLGYVSLPFVLTLVLLVAGVFAMFYGKEWDKRTKWSSLIIKMAMVTALFSGLLF